MVYYFLSQNVYLLKYFEICHKFLVPFWDIYFQILTHFGPDLIIFVSKIIVLNLKKWFL